MNYLDCNYVPGQGLQVKIDKDELEKLMQDDKREQKRQEDLDYLEECKSDKDEYRDTGMRPSDYV